MSACLHILRDQLGIAFLLIPICIKDLGLMGMGAVLLYSLILNIYAAWL